MALTENESLPAAYAIFEGGGVKGSALVGALAESVRHVNIVGVGGTSAGTFLSEVLYLLTKALEAVPPINLRVYVLPCNFVGTTAYRQEWDTEVSGDRFWEHWSRLLKTGKKCEEAIGTGKTFLLVAVEELIQRIEIPDGWSWSSTKILSLASEVELLAKATTVKYGALARTIH